MPNHPYKKKWGQNFIKDNNVIRKIINIIDPGKDDKIIENYNLAIIKRQYGISSTDFQYLSKNINPLNYEKDKQKVINKLLNL